MEGLDVDAHRRKARAASDEERWKVGRAAADVQQSRTRTRFDEGANRSQKASPASQPAVDAAEVSEAPEGLRFGHAGVEQFQVGRTPAEIDQSGP